MKLTQLLGLQPSRLLDPWVLPDLHEILCWGQGGAYAISWHRLNATLPLTAIRVTCTGSCGVSTKANDGAWVVEESYFNSSLSLADKGECGSQQ